MPYLHVGEQTYI